MLNRDLNAYLMSNGFVLLKGKDCWKIVALVALAKKRKTIYFPLIYRDQKVIYEKRRVL